MWGRYAWCEDDSKIAFITLYKYSVRGVHYLWAKWGPAWVKEASPEREAALRADLVREIKAKDKTVAFVRLHAIYQHPDLCMPLQTISSSHPSSSTPPARPKKRSSPRCPRRVSVRSAPA